jgi:hypothetical protein
MKSIGRGAITANNPPTDEAGLNFIDEGRVRASDVGRPERPPAFFKNALGVVTNRQQFLKYYEYELSTGKPIGPHIFSRR